MSWSVDVVQKLSYTHSYLLPTGDFLLRKGKERLKVTGWLPCHHSNVEYELELKPAHGDRSRIVNVTHMKTTGKIKRDVLKVVARRIRSSKKFSPHYYTAEKYIQQANEAYESVALRVCTVLYSYWELKKMDVQETFSCIQHNIEHLMYPSTKVFRRRFLKEPRKTIQKVTALMGETPFSDWEGLEARVQWHTQTNTASRERLSEHIPEIQHYQGLWTTKSQIREAQQFAKWLRPDNISLMCGSATPSTIPEDAIIVVRNYEDAYKWKCDVDWGTICILRPIPSISQERLVELGVSDVQQLEYKQNIIVPWSHYWSYDDWHALRAFEPTHITAIGREDQWPIGRGQLFRDMLSSQRFDVTKCYHAATDCVEMVQTDDINRFVAQIHRQHRIVQCFSDIKWPDVDCKRCKLMQPFRIRTIRDDSQTDHITLYEEKRIYPPDRILANASVIPIRYYQGLRVPTGIYICDENTTAFDVHVARSYCRDKLYVVNCKTCLFSLQKQAPKRITINPFID